MEKCWNRYQEERERLGRFHKMAVHECASREESGLHPVGKTLQAKWAWINKGTETPRSAMPTRISRTRLWWEVGRVARWNAEPCDHQVVAASLPSGTPRLCSSVSSAFLYNDMRIIVYIELPQQDPEPGNPNLFDKLK